MNDVSSNFGFLDPLTPLVAPVLASQIAPKFYFYPPLPPPQMTRHFWMVPYICISII